MQQKTILKIMQILYVFTLYTKAPERLDKQPSF